MRVLVWGLGYVGTVTAACAAELGHEVIGIEPNPAKVDAIRNGKSAVREPGLDEAVGRAVAGGRLTVEPAGTDLVRDADLSLVCVGTPSNPDGGPLTDHLQQVSLDIGEGLRRSERYHVVAIRSTVFPGTCRNLVARVLEERSGRRRGEDFGLVSNPEFLRETTAIQDFHEAPYTVIGQLDSRSGDAAVSLYAGLSAPVLRVSLEEAELLKLANNAFHAMKIGFANEIGRIGERAGVDAGVVMNMVCADTKLNISPAYLRPGFAFGGSCLPKDLRSLVFHGRRLGVELPILEGVLRSNQEQIAAVRVRIHALGVRRIAILGLGFKPGTDDLRESPVIALIRDLWQDGIDVTVHDPDIRPDTMMGSNREFLERQLPQVRQILRGRIEDALETCEAVVVTQSRPEFTAAVGILPRRIPVLDLVRAAPAPAAELAVGAPAGER
jgi:GDP-mannose 6-dehydrogenase